MGAFEKAVRKALIDHEMKLTDLAKELEVSVSYLYELITGTRNTKHQLIRICEILGMDVNTWVTE